MLENIALRQQLLVLHTQRPRRRFTAPHKLFWVLLRKAWDGWKRPLILLTPRTVVDCEIVQLPLNLPDRMRYPKAILERVRELAQNLPDAEIAAQLNRDGPTSSPTVRRQHGCRLTDRQNFGERQAKTRFVVDGSSRCSRNHTRRVFCPGAQSAVVLPRTRCWSPERSRSARQTARMHTERRHAWRDKGVLLA